MDDQQPKPPSDLSGYSGVYPSEPVASPQAPGNEAPVPFTTVAAAPTEVAPAAVQESSTLSQAPNVEPFAPPPQPEVTAQGQPPTGTPPADNPFVFQAPASAAPPKKSGVKRIFLLFFAIVALLALGYGAFMVAGRFLTSRQPIVINYWGLWENEQILSTIISQFQEQHPNVQITYTKQSPRQYRERLQAALERGEGPDIFRFHNTWVPMLKNDLAPAEKTGYTAQEFQATFYPVAQQDLVIGGQVYGAPLMFDGLGLYYNEELLRAAGISPPTTWEEFRDAALALTVKDETGKIVTAGAALGLTSNIEHFSDILALMMLQNGADLANPTSQEAQQALAFYRLFAEKPGNVWDETLDNSILAFASGKVAFIFAPSWQVFTIRDINPQLSFKIIPVPQLPGSAVSWASYWVEGIAKNSKHKDEAWEFLKFLTSKENMVKLYSEQSKLRAFGEPYSRVDLAQTLISDPYVGAFMQQAQTAKSFFLASRTYDNGINDRMIKYLEDAVNSQAQGVSPEEALQVTAQGFSQVLTSFGFSGTQR